MKTEKKQALFQLIGHTIDTAIDLGMAQQRHIDAAQDEHEAANEVAGLVQQIESLFQGNPNKRKDLN